MTYKIARAARETTSTTGAIDVTDTLDLAGATDTHLQTFVAAVGTGNQTSVRIISGDDTAWMEAVVTVTDGTPDTLTIDDITASSAAGAGITLTAGSRVFGVIPPDWDDLFDRLYGSTEGLFLRRDATGWTGYEITIADIPEIDVTGVAVGDHLQWDGSQFIASSIGLFESVLIEKEGGASGTTQAIDHYVSGGSGDTSFPFLGFRQAQGTKASSSAVLDGDMLGGIGGYGWEGGDWHLGASVQIEATEDWDGTGHGTRMLFSVTEVGTTTPTFSLVIEHDQMLFNGEVVVVGSGGGSANYSDEGAWNGTIAYDKGSFVTNGGAIYFAMQDIPAPSGTPGADGYVQSDGGGSTSHVLPALSTGGFPDTIVVAAAWNSDTITISSITSDSGLVFVQRASITKTIITGHKTRLEMWTAPSAGQLVGEVITIHYSASPGDAKAAAFGAYGGDISSPLDANGSLPKYASGDRTAPTVTGFSTTTADDLLIFLAASDADGGAGTTSNTAPAGWTLSGFQGVLNNSSSNNISLAVSVKLVSATQSDITIAGPNDPSCWAVIAHAVKASGATNPAPLVDSRWVQVDAGSGVLDSGAVADVLEDALDEVLGTPAQGSLIVKGASSYDALAPGADAKVLTITGGVPSWETASGGGGGVAAGNTAIVPKIYRPTKVSSGFTNATIGTSSPTTTDTDAGVLLTSNHADGAYTYKTAPGTPYEYTALLSMGPYDGVVFFGFSDGTKYQVLYAPGLGQTDAGKAIVSSYSSYAVFNTTHATLSSLGTHGDRVWMRVGDDGTNVSFKVSTDGVNWVTVYTVAKASGYLGASGYTRIVMGVTGAGFATMLSLDDGTGTLGELVTGASGLYRQVMSAIPTAASTGLSAWLNQGTASVADTDAGICITAPATAGDQVRTRSKAAPSTPYKITALVSLEASSQQYQFVGLGWHDGTKIHIIDITFVAGTGWCVEVTKFTNSTTFSAADVDPVVRQPPTTPMWLQIEDNGTTVYFRTSADGKNFREIFSVAKASGFLGSSGYTNVGFVTNRNNNQGSTTAYATLHSWKVE